MLKAIIVKNFKCFKEETVFPLGQLTLLTGINGRGKSTMLQSLLLMRQSIEHNENGGQLVLNGSCVNLGGFNEIRNSNVSREESIIFKYLYEDIGELTENNPFKIVGYAQYSFEENYQDDMVAQISRIEFDDDIIVEYFDKVDSNIYNSIRYKIDSVYPKSVQSKFDFERIVYKYISDSLKEKETTISSPCLRPRYPMSARPNPTAQRVGG
ncbi:MAG: AAA family ATPase [Symploca sp. SIO3E6]|nr:AAA family ATPase [Caldora sp. SIO3E6]